MRRYLYPVEMKPLLPCLLLLLTASPIFAAAPPKPKVAPAPLLPVGFADWKLAAPAQTGAAPMQADSAHAAVLQEDGLTGFANAIYTTGAGKKVAVRAFRFQDATGAFAAFTFYRHGGAQPLRVGQGAGENGAYEAGHALFWSGATLVDADFSAPGSKDAAAADLSALAAALPRVGGSAAIPPPLPTYLPADALPGSVRYSIGPAAYAGAGNPVPAEVIDFGRDAEVVSGTYRPRAGGEGQLTLVMYPTPQLAVNREKALVAFASEKAPGSGFQEKRLGAMVAYTTGGLSQGEAEKLLGGIRYRTEVIINHPEGYVSEVAKAAKLLLGIGYLTGILGVGAVILALFLGAGRVLVRKVRGKPISSMNDDDFISLKIDG